MTIEQIDLIDTPSDAQYYTAMAISAAVTVGIGLLFLS
ncbi:MAG: hypothetical protein JWO25_3496 [Alphaproteobacteria bacterium]|nr:hypothetical protein [Alphaproteobacteria bacterium]MDB5719845.1 hypothetical protein [Alphaproteobacteria bacterium]